jgi:hypothetical protein
MRPTGEVDADGIATLASSRSEEHVAHQLRIWTKRQRLAGETPSTRILSATDAQHLSDLQCPECGHPLCRRRGSHMKSQVELYQALVRLYRATLPSFGDTAMSAFDKDELRDACKQAETALRLRMRGSGE